MARKFTKLFVGNIAFAIGKRVFRKIASMFTLPRPTLVIDGDEMIIGDASGLAENVEIYANGELVKRLYTNQKILRFTVQLLGSHSGDTHTFEYEGDMTWDDFVKSDYNKIVNGERSFIAYSTLVQFNGVAYGYSSDNSLSYGGSFYYDDENNVAKSVRLASQVCDVDTYCYRPPT